MFMEVKFFLAKLMIVF